jgi:septal ring factor EnvC (AmiA/AmiB activator)
MLTNEDLDGLDKRMRKIFREEFGEVFDSILKPYFDSLEEHNVLMRQDIAELKQTQTELRKSQVEMRKSQDELKKSQVELQKSQIELQKNQVGLQKNFEMLSTNIVKLSNIAENHERRISKVESFTRS